MKGAGAVWYEESVSFDGVILDYSIPAEERAEVAAKIRELHSKIPILATFRFPGELDRTVTKFIYSLDGPEAMLRALKEMLSGSLESQLDQAQEQKNRASRNSIN